MNNIDEYFIHDVADADINERIDRAFVVKGIIVELSRLFPIINHGKSEEGKLLLKHLIS